jgi:dTDP-4-amino-4,6-dideoxygalactose transaminase
MMVSTRKSNLAFHGGPRAVQSEPGDIFTWPIITPEHEQAVLDVLRSGGMSGTDVTQQFENEFAAWQGTRYALGFNNGTAALHAAMFGCEVGVGDEIICPSLTFWASALQCFSLGATVVFSEIDPDTLCMDPADIEHRITQRTRAIMVVHYLGHPADMDSILAIARRHGVRVIEDVSHAQGGLYKGRRVGTLGDVAGMSLMSGKSFAIGEAGMLVTNAREIYERAIAFGHYGRYGANVETESLKPSRGLPLGGYKYRMHQLSAAVGRVQLKSYDDQAGEIRRAMNGFWDQLEGLPGIGPRRPPKDSSSNMGGWYAPSGLYRPEELGGLSVSRFAEAVRAEGSSCKPGVNRPLHLHPLFNTYDVYGDGKPTRIAHSDRDVRQPRGSLPVSEKIAALTYSIPWFKRYRPRVIEEHASAFRKVAENYQDLLADDPGNPEGMGNWA